MSEHGVSWCDQCRVLSLHTPGITDPMGMPIHDVFAACTTAEFTSTALGAPPVALAKLTAECGSCPAGQVAIPDGTCVPDCPVDVVLDAAGLASGSTTSLPTTMSQPGDTCPETFVVRMENVGGLYGGSEATKVSLEPTFPSATSCPGSYSLEQVLTKAGASTTANASGTGVWSPCPAGDLTCPPEGGRCGGLPTHPVTAVMADVAVYRAAAASARTLLIRIPTFFE